MKYYCFNQNNTFGVFDSNDKVTEHVYIQARTAKEANKKAQKIGIYFDGCEAGRDCECCGDRWYPVDEDDGSHAETFEAPFIVYLSSGDRILRSE